MNLIWLVQQGRQMILTWFTAKSPFASLSASVSVSASVYIAADAEDDASTGKMDTYVRGCVTFL